MLGKMIIESYRNKQNRPLSFFVNYLGLTLGFAAVIIMYLYIMGELNHDKGVYADSMEQVYQCNVEKSNMGAVCPAPLAEMASKMPEVETSTLVGKEWQQKVETVGLATNNRLNIDITTVDSTFFKVFPFKILSGDTNPLRGSNNVVISRQVAMRLFGTLDVVGRGLNIIGKCPVQIAALMEDVPANSTIAPEIVVNLRYYNKMCYGDNGGYNLERWNNWSYEAYIRLNNSVDPVAFKPKYAMEVVKSRSQFNGTDINEALKKLNNDNTPSILPFKDIYFSGVMANNAKSSGNMDALTVLGLIATLILVIAIINYINIYTARSTEVIRAMGIKAIMGAQRRALVGFVIFDSWLLTELSAVSGFVLAMALEPLYPSFLGMTVPFELNWESTLVIFGALPLLSGILSGIFPALALTRLRPLEAIGSQQGGNLHMVGVRNFLIVLQFTIAIALTASTLYINKQMRYMSNLDLGYNRENIFVVSGNTFMGPKWEAFRSTLLTNPKVVNVAYMQQAPVRVGSMTTVSWGESKDEKSNAMVMSMDENGMATCGIKMLEGDSISPTNVRTMGWGKYVVNETFAKQLRAKIPGLTFPYRNLLGVFRNFQHSSLTTEAGPLVIGSIWFEGPNPYGNAMIRIQSDGMKQTLNFIEKSFNDIFPDEIYEGRFMDEMFNQVYEKHQLFENRLTSFSLLAVVISCLGLFALVGYSVERRRKEIGIRKVYGSTVTQVIVLLAKGFLKWLAISFAIAIVPVWYVMTTWAEQFVVRTPLSWWIFALAGVVAFVVAMLTVLGQTYYAATANPVKSIKSE
ncbi:MAG: FtsX-like permease family protein [Mucinivorans sp.]